MQKIGRTDFDPFNIKVRNDETVQALTIKVQLFLI